MIYPLISEYIASILDAKDNFATLTHLTPVLTEDDLPMMSSGNFAVVFKMLDERDGRYYAVKCFTKDQDGRSDAYRDISNYISRNESNYLIRVKYLDFELFVNSKNSEETEYPVLLMEWVEGITLDKYITEYEGNSYVLHDLCVEFSKMSHWLISNPIAHGDIKPDNILVRPTGELVLIDYDGMYVPSMKGQQARELGSINYRHPGRTIEDFDEHIDDLPLAAIALSIKAMSISYGILSETGNKEAFLFNEGDYLALDSSNTFQRIIDLMYEDSSIAPYCSTFAIACSRSPLLPEHFVYGDLYVSELLALNNVGDQINGFHRHGEPVDEQGVIYSPDGKCVLFFDYEKNVALVDITIKEGVICVCENAFNSGLKDKRNLNIHLPRSLRFFTQDSFHYGYDSLSWDSPWFSYKDGFVYSSDYTSCIMQCYTENSIDPRVRIIEQNCFHNLDVLGLVLPPNLIRIKRAAFKLATINPVMTLPDGLRVIDDHAFEHCDVEEIVFGQHLLFLGEKAFLGSVLRRAVFSYQSPIRVIAKWAFYYCINLEEVVFPRHLYSIESYAFFQCDSIKSIAIPNINLINDYAFEDCESLVSVAINSCNETKLGEGVFKGCTSLTSFISASIEILPKDTFKDCGNLQVTSFTNLKEVGSSAFLNCTRLSFSIPQKVSSIEPGAFNNVYEIIGNEHFVYEDSVLYNSERTTIFTCNQRGPIIIIPNGVSEIRASSLAFSHKQIVLPSSISNKSIQDLMSINGIYIQIPVGHAIPDRDDSDYNYCEYKIGSDDIYIDESGAIYSSDKSKLLYYPSSLELESYSVLKECVVIDNRAFPGDLDVDPEFGCWCGGNSLKKLILPPHLRSIGEDAFHGCIHIQELDLPDSLESLGAMALEGCKSLNKLLLPSSLRHMGANALPKRLEFIETKTINFPIIGNCLLSPENELLWIPPEISELNLPNSITYKGKKCSTYYNCIVSTTGELLWTINADTFDFPRGVKIIAKDAFSTNKRIKSLKIPNGVVRIERGAFFNNNNLTSFYLPPSINYIGNLRTYQGWGRKYIEYYYPQEIHVPPGMKHHFLALLPGICLDRLIDDYTDY